jgi:hypothetical protein
MGVFEMKPFAEGTLAMARALADSEGTDIVGGGTAWLRSTQHRAWPTRSTTSPRAVGAIARVPEPARAAARRWACLQEAPLNPTARTKIDAGAT